MGKPSKITPEAVSTLPAEFLPFARSLVAYLGGRAQEPYPNPLQQSLLGGFFGQPQARTQPIGMGERIPPPFNQVLPPPGGTPFERDFQGGDLRSLAVAEGRPLFGPPGADPTFGGSRGNALLMGLMNRLFPGYAQRAGQGMPRPGEPMAGPWGAIGGREAPWGGGTVGGLMDLRAESAARGMRIGTLMDEINEQRAAMGLPPL